MEKFKDFIREAESVDKQKFKGVFNWHGENITLYASATSDAQAKELFQLQLAKKLGVYATKVKSYYTKNQNGYKVTEVV